MSNTAGETPQLDAGVLPEEIVADLNYLRGELGKRESEAHSNAADFEEGSEEDAYYHGRFQAYRDARKEIEAILSEHVQNPLQAICVTCGEVKSVEKFEEGDCTCNDCYDEGRSGVNYDIGPNGEVVEL